METRFDFALTKPQVIEVFQKQSRKIIKIMLILALVLLLAAIVLAIAQYLIENFDTFNVAMWFLFLDIIAWAMFIVIRRSVPKNAERYFKYNSANDVVEFSYLLTEVDFVVSQPTLGNVIHFKYDTISRVNDLGGYVSVMLESNQFLPILVNEHTAPLINTLKSFAKIKK